MSDERTTDSPPNQIHANPEVPRPIRSEAEALLPNADNDCPEDQIRHSKKEPERETRAIEWAQLGVSLALAIIGIFVLCIYWGQLDTMQRTLKEIEKGSGDTHELAVAAGKQADAAKAQADNTAKQVRELDASVRQASRLAKATETANANVLNADRPWIGASLTVDGFETNKAPKVTLTFTNSGKRPAKVTLIQYRWTMYSEFPKNVTYPPSGPEESTSIILPNTHPSVNFTMETVTDPVMQIIKSGAATMYVHADIEYDDLLTGQHHWTHACWQYTHFDKGVSSGFYACHEYNEAN
jgi:hypothetical protein